MIHSNNVNKVISAIGIMLLPSANKYKTYFTPLSSFHERGPMWDAILAMHSTHMVCVEEVRCHITSNCESFFSFYKK